MRTGARSPRRATSTLMAMLALGPAIAGCSRPEPPTHGVIVLGIDGMDHGLTQRLIAEGKLPNLARLAEEGRFQPLGTSIPPQSPVAWSDFITGLDSGGHGIYDFLHRDPETIAPYLSTSRTDEPSGRIRLGNWQFALRGGEISLLRHGTPFWEVLEDRGIPTTIVHMPANFPPSGTASRELSGMGTPDIRGSYGTFTFFTSDPDQIGGTVSGGRIYPARVVGNTFRGVLTGPDNPFLVRPTELEADFTIRVDAVRPVVRIEVGGEEMILAEGEWSQWVQVEFRMLPLLKGLRGICRFYLKSVRPDFELYVTPVNIDPLDAAMPISTPAGFAEELAEATGRYYTQGMPEDTKALSAGVLDEEDFLRQAAMAAEENRRQYDLLLDSFEGGLLFHYFGFLDQVSHMMWRATDPEHPAHDSIADAPYRHVVEDLYREADELVGETLRRIDDDVTLVVMSDHGFTSWTRAMSINSWLLENNYLALLDPDRQGEMEFFGNVDWSRTRAYGVGLSGLYLNLEGRERYGIVPPEEREALLEELGHELLGLVDPATDRPVITKIYPRDETYTGGTRLDHGPDLVIGYARGVRASDDSAIGVISLEVLSDNTQKWSGDHIMDHEEVPGILFTNRPLRRPVSSLKDLAAAIVAEFGIDGFPPSGATDTTGGDATGSTH